MIQTIRERLPDVDVSELPVVVKSNSGKVVPVASIGWEDDHIYIRTSEGLPPVVARYLENHNYVAITSEEYQKLLHPEPKPSTTVSPWARGTGSGVRCGAPSPGSGRSRRRWRRFVGNCGSCGHELEMFYHPDFHGMINIGVEDDGSVYTWMRHIDGPNNDCDIYSWRVYEEEVDV